MSRKHTRSHKKRFSMFQPGQPFRTRGDMYLLPSSKQDLHIWTRNQQLALQWLRAHTKQERAARRSAQAPEQANQAQANKENVPQS